MNQVKSQWSNERFEGIDPQTLDSDTSYSGVFLDKVDQDSDEEIPLRGSPAQTDLEKAHPLKRKKRFREDVDPSEKEATVQEAEVHDASGPHRSRLQHSPLYPHGLSHGGVIVFAEHHDKKGVDDMVSKWFQTSHGMFPTLHVMLINYILELSGYPQDLLPLEGQHPENIIEWVREVLETHHQNHSWQVSHLIQKTKKKSAHQVFPSFPFYPYVAVAQKCPWRVLCNSFLRDFTHGVLTLTTLAFRHVRQVATQACLTFYETFVERYQIFEKNKEKTQSNSRRKMQPLYEGKDLVTQGALETLQGYVVTIFKHLIGCRWRDCCPFIRRITFSSLFKIFQVCTVKELFEEKSIQLISFALSDRNDAVRESAAEFLAHYLTDPPCNPLLWKSGFFETFLPRLIQLTRDRCPSICIWGVVIMKCLVKKGLLHDAHVEQVIQGMWGLPSLLVMDAQDFPLAKRRVGVTLLTHFAEFINLSIFSISVLDHESAHKCENFPSTDLSQGNLNLFDLQVLLRATFTRRATVDSHEALVLRCFLEFILEFVDDYETCIDHVVTAFWSQVTCLHRVDVLIQFLYGTPTGTASVTHLEPLTSKHRVPLVLLVHSILRHLQLAFRLRETPFRIEIKKHTTASQGNESVESLQLFGATEYLLTMMVPLLRHTKSHAVEFSSVTRLLYEATLYAENVTQQLPLDRCLDYLVDLFLNMTDTKAPYGVLASLLCSLDSLWTKTQGTSDYITNVLKQLISQLQKKPLALDSLHTTNDSTAYLYCLCLKCLSLSCSATVNPYQWCSSEVLQEAFKGIAEWTPSCCSDEATFLNSLIALGCLTLAYDFFSADLRCLGHADVASCRTPWPCEPFVQETTPVPLSPNASVQMEKKKDLFFQRQSWRSSTMKEDLSTSFHTLCDVLNILHPCLWSLVDDWMNRALSPFLELFASYVASMTFLSLAQFYQVEMLPCSATSPLPWSETFNESEIKFVHIEAAHLDRFQSLWTKKLRLLDEALDQGFFSKMDATEHYESTHVGWAPWMLNSSSHRIDQELFLFFYQTLSPYFHTPLDSSQGGDLSFENPVYSACYLWMTCSLVHHMLASPLLSALAVSDVGVTLFCLFSHEAKVLTGLLKQVVKAFMAPQDPEHSQCPPSATGSLIFVWLTHSIQVVYASSSLRSRLKTILLKVSNCIDPQFIFSSLDDLFLCFHQVLKKINAIEEKQQTFYMETCLIQLLPKTKDEATTQHLFGHFKKHFGFLPKKKSSTFSNLFCRRYSRHLGPYQAEKNTLL